MVESWTEPCDTRKRHLIPTSDICLTVFFALMASWSMDCMSAITSISCFGGPTGSCLFRRRWPLFDCLLPSLLPDRLPPPLLARLLSLLPARLDDRLPPPTPPAPHWSSVWPTLGRVTVLPLPPPPLEPRVLPLLLPLLVPRLPPRLRLRLPPRLPPRDLRPLRLLRRLLRPPARVGTRWFWSCTATGPWAMTKPWSGAGDLWMTRR